jgi:hypothetical protein
MNNVKCIGCSEQFDQDEKFQRSEFATDEYCKYCSYNSHEEKQMLKPMTQKEQENYWMKQACALMYNKFGHMSNKKRREHGVWFQDEQGMKDD